MSTDIPENGVTLTLRKRTVEWEADQFWGKIPIFLVEALTEFIQILLSKGYPVCIIHELPEEVIPGRETELIPKTSWKEYFAIQERLTHITSEYPHTRKIIEETGFFGSLEILVGLDLTPQTVRTHPIEKVIWWRLHPKGIDEAGLSESISRVGQDFLLLCLDCDGERLNTLATKGYFKHLGRLYTLLGLDVGEDNTS
jgi:hypothetical protein